MKEPGSKHKGVIQRPGWQGENEHQLHSEVIVQSHDQRETPPTQQVGSIVHVADQVVSSRRQLLEERVCVAIEGQVFDAPFGWSAGEAKAAKEEKGLGVTGKRV